MVSHYLDGWVGVCGEILSCNQMTTLVLTTTAHSHTNMQALHSKHIHTDKRAYLEK